MLVLVGNTISVGGEDFDCKAGSSTNKQCISTVNKNINDGGFLAWDMVITVIKSGEMDSLRITCSVYSPYVIITY